MMQFSSERQLQDYCLQVLRSKNMAARAEVWCGNVRAAIVTDRAVMELKKVLDRASIYQAYGQAMTYQKTLNKPEVWIVGQTPIDVAERATAFTVAKEISAPNIKVSFIESDPFWRMEAIALPRRFHRFSLSRQSVAILSLMAIALIASSIGVPQLQASPDKAVDSPATVAAVPVAIVPASSRAIALQPPTPLSPAVRLSRCGNGSIANFRRSPSLAEASVFGVLQAGDAVQPTGQIVQADGVTWVEAASFADPFRIAPAQYPNQIGWIAQCFFGG